jgi:hypothetical protein
MRPILFAAALLLAGPVIAAEPGEPLPPPPLTESAAIEEAEELQPEVTIRTRGDATVEEYRSNGRLYMVKITPSRGYPYYLIDSDGDGSFDTRRNELDPPNINRWILFRW